MAQASVSTPKSRTPQQQAAIDRQLAIEKAAFAGAPKTTQTVTPPAPTSGLNTSGLLEANARRKNGTANATDLANLAYAESKGWSPATGVSTPTAPTPTTIPGLNTNGLTEAYARKMAGTANDTDLKNLAYAQSKGWSPSQSSGQTIMTPDQANAEINAKQAEYANSNTDTSAPGTRSTVEEFMKQIQNLVTPKTEAPATPNFEQSLLSLRQEYGILDTENQLNDLRAERDNLTAAYQQLFGKERNKTVAMGVIEGRIGAEERAMNERLTVLDNAINAASNQLTTKYNIVNTIMGAKEMDYNAATASYDKQMQQNISVFNAAQSMEEALKSDEQRAIDNARSNAQIMINSLIETGTAFSELSPDQQAVLTKLGTESGLGSGFYSTIFNKAKEQGKKVLTHIVSDDKSQVTILYEGGTTETIPIGWDGNPNDTTTDERLADFSEAMAGVFTDLNTFDKDGNPNLTWQGAREIIQSQFPELSLNEIDRELAGGITVGYSKDWANLDDFLQEFPSLEREANYLKTQKNPDTGSKYKDTELIYYFTDKYKPDFSAVGGDTNTAAIKTLTTNLKIGEWGGQCGEFVNDYTSLRMGDSYASKYAYVDKSIRVPSSGDVFVMKYEDTGHTGFVDQVAYNSDGSFRGIYAFHSNYGLNEKISRDFIPASSLTGFIRPKFNNLS